MANEEEPNESPAGVQQQESVTHEATDFAALREELSALGDGERCISDP